MSVVDCANRSTTTTAASASVAWRGDRRPRAASASAQEHDQRDDHGMARAGPDVDAAEEVRPDERGDERGQDGATGDERTARLGDDAWQTARGERAAAQRDDEQVLLGIAEEARAGDDAIPCGEIGV